MRRIGIAAVVVALGMVTLSLAVEPAIAPPPSQQTLAQVSAPTFTTVVVTSTPLPPTAVPATATVEPTSTPEPIPTVAPATATAEPVPTEAPLAVARLEPSTRGGQREVPAAPAVIATATQVPPPPPTATPVPPSPPPPPPPPPAASGEVGFSLNLLNSARAAHGLAPLQLDQQISAAAAGHAAEMAQHNYLSHTNRQGQQPWDRMRAAGAQFGTAGENLGRAWVGDGPHDPAIQAMHDMMMAETPPNDGHRKNVLNPAYRRVGVGVAKVNGDLYWACDFAD